MPSRIKKEHENAKRFPGRVRASLRNTRQLLGATFPKSKVARDLMSEMSAAGKKHEHMSQNELLSLLEVKYGLDNGIMIEKVLHLVLNLNKDLANINKHPKMDKLIKQMVRMCQIKSQNTKIPKCAANLCDAFNRVAVPGAPLKAPRPPRVQ